MKKFLKRLNWRKGFTLLECIIAIAVFAALTLVVMAILTYARNEAANANATEENLTMLIENIIEDDTQKKYYSGSDFLELDVEGATDSFDVSYNVIDGYKNFIVCTNEIDPTTHEKCSYHGDNTEFIGDIEQKDFVQTNPFTCPKCGGDNIIQLQCQECMATGPHTDLNAFQYIPSTGGFYCMVCGSANVRDPKSDELVVERELISVNSMVANGLVYGKVPQNVDDSTTPEDDREKLIDLFTIGDGTLVTYEITPVVKSDAAINISIDYEADESQTIPGTYTMTVSKPTISSVINGADGTLEAFCLRVNMPPYYKILGLEHVNATATDGIPRVQCSEADDAPLGKNGYIDFKFEKNGATSITVKFQLVNYKSGHSFDYDYAAANLFAPGGSTDLDGHGLGGHWFGTNNIVPLDTVTANQHPTHVQYNVNITEPEDE